MLQPELFKGSVFLGDTENILCQQRRQEELREIQSAGSGDSSPGSWVVKIQGRCRPDLMHPAFHQRHSDHRLQFHPWLCHEQPAT